MSRADGDPLGDRGVVHDAVEPAEGVPRVVRHGDGGVEVAEVDRPQPRLGRVRRHSASTASRRSRRRATMPTVAPRSASIGASAAPMPDDAPVTRIVEPAICMAGERSIGVETARGGRGG